MKTTKIALIILMFYIGFSNICSGQVLSDEKKQSSQELYDFHISKKKANSTAAWITLGVGIAMVIGGYGWNSSTGFDGDLSNNYLGIGIGYYLGGGKWKIN